jgi:gas vesicle protein GvpL/GvpF
VRTRSGHGPAVPAPALQLCAIVALDSGAPLRVADAQLISFRDLGALVRNTRFVPVAAEQAEVAAYRAVVEGAFATCSVVPAPFGTVFRNRDSLHRWLELHYFTLEDALRYLNERQVARVRITPGLSAQGWDTVEHNVREADLEVTAFDSFRVIRRAAAAFLPVAVQGRKTEEGAEAAFLVDRDQWQAFVAAVKEEQRRLPDLRFEQTGPWPPYDFLRLDLNG